MEQTQAMAAQDGRYGAENIFVKYATIFQDEGFFQAALHISTFWVYRAPKYGLQTWDTQICSKCTSYYWNRGKAILAPVFWNKDGVMWSEKGKTAIEGLLKQVINA